MVATGTYHKLNVLKFRIMLACFDADRPLTCREIADELGVPPVNISAVMNHYREKNCGYFQRLKPIKEQGKAYRYKITKKGLKYLGLYAYRLHEGFDLSLGARKIKTMPKRARLMAEREAESYRRQAEFERTGIEQPRKPKPTLKEILNFDPADLSDYIGITKQGALELKITGIEIIGS